MSVDITETDANPVEGSQADADLKANVDAIHQASVDAADNTAFLPGGTTADPNIWYIGAPDGFQGYALRPGHAATNRGAAGLGIEGADPETTVLGVGLIDDGDSVAIRYEDDVASHDNVLWKDVTFDGFYQNYDFANEDTVEDWIRVFTDFTGTFQNVRIRNIQNGGIRAFANSDLTFDRCTFHDIVIGRHQQTDGDLGSQPISLTSGECNVEITNSEFTLIGSNPIDYGNGVTGDLVVNSVYAEGCGVGFLKINDMSTFDLNRINHIGQTDADDDFETDLVGEYENVATPFYGRWFFRRQDGNTTAAVPGNMNNIRARNMARGVIRIANGYDVDITSAAAPINFENVMTAELESTQNQDEAIEDPNSSIGFDVDEIAFKDLGGTCFNLNASDGTIDEVRRQNTDGLGAVGNVTIGTDNQGGALYAVDVPAKAEVGINSAQAQYSTDMTEYDVGAI